MGSQSGIEAPVGPLSLDQVRGVWAQWGPEEPRRGSGSEQERGSGDREGLGGLYPGTFGRQGTGDAAPGGPRSRVILNAPLGSGLGEWVAVVLKAGT